MKLKKWKEFIGEAGRAYDAIRKGLRVADKGVMKRRWTIQRWASEEDRAKGVRYSASLARRLFGGIRQVTQFSGNVLLNEGINELWTILCSSGGTKFDNATAQLGTGTSSAGEDPAHTDLQTAGVWKGMMTSFPTFGTLQKATWKSEFLSAEANQAWNEFSVRNGVTANKNLNRKVSAQGTKVAGQTWELTLEITLS